MSHLKCTSASQSLGAGYVFVVLTPHAKSHMYAATRLLAAHCPPPSILLYFPLRNLNVAVDRCFGTFLTAFMFATCALMEVLSCDVPVSCLCHCGI
jgi:hypothetical protein